MNTLLLLLSLLAQTPAFDVASIKPNSSDSNRSSLRPTKGRLTAENVSLQKLILNAYGVPDDRDYAISGPAWLATQKFDLETTFPPDTPPAQIRPMLQKLLADRFQLTLHKETRQLTMYRLVASKTGSKLHPVEAGNSRTTGGPGKLEATKTSMAKLADLLGKQVGFPVSDATGLEGAFDFNLEWSPEDANANGPSIFTALQEQLGLKLENAKGPVEVLVVDRMEKMPVAN